MTTSSAIIPTYHRPDDLNNCLESILRQTALPTELIIVDDGDLPGFPMQGDFEKRGVRCKFLEKEIPGVTESRNLGAKSASGDILIFLEDDVVLFDDYIEQLLSTFERHAGTDVAGVGGIIDNDRFQSAKVMLQRIPNLLFGMSGLREGRILRSGFATDYGSTERPIREEQDVDFLLGGVSAFKRSVFDEFQFSNRYKSKNGYGQGEDKEFSYRVSRKYRLLVNPKARLYHYCAPKTDYNRHIRGRATVLSKYYFFRDQVKKSPVDWFFFWYATFGYVLYRTAITLVSFKKREWQRLSGIISGMADAVKGRDLDSL
ncbi:MAG: glycosyltransferase family 2 protein [Endozoicomonas sp.]